ncbi:hypothetical protein J5N97_013259 [Dioscorea zingiberensis]|uniref:Autophagy-related protein n=1 Tax=Dioscorea zingiberensis TaxID=325984 RepID=A0A9D5CT12_9LILI|nr:hypothetical protein J5N97_013259 [Dioscorea zingiberensis]
MMSEGSILVIVEKDDNSDVPQIRKRFMVPEDMTIAKLVTVFLSKINLTARKAIFLFVDDVLLPSVMNFRNKEHTRFWPGIPILALLRL